MNSKITFVTQMDGLKWEGTHIWNRGRNRVRHVYPHRSPYTPRSRLLHEITKQTRSYKYCIADRDGLPVMLFITYAEAQDVCEKININMAKKVLS